MWGQFQQYFLCLYHNIPQFVFGGLLLVLCLGSVPAIIQKDAKKKRKIIAFIILSEYLFLLFLSTVYYRAERSDYKHELTPFGSYFTICEGNSKMLLIENILNVMVFLPIGFMICCIKKDIKCRYVALIGFIISVIVEMLQYFCMKGFLEIDDVIHNTLGCMLGFGVCKLARKEYERIGKRSVGVG